MSTWGDRRDRFWGLPVPAHLKHGPQTWAKKAYGCDCKVCLPSGRRHPPAGGGKSATVRGRELRARKRGTPVPATVSHGTQYAYAVYGCRCDSCRAWHVAKNRAKRQAWRLTARGHYHDDVERGVTVIHWPPRELTEPWLCPVCREFKVIP